jgi:hypothetical protein
MSDNATISLTEKEFSLFRELIYKEAGISLGNGKQQLVESHLRLVRYWLCVYLLGVHALRCFCYSLHLSRLLRVLFGCKPYRLSSCRKKAHRDTHALWIYPQYEEKFSIEMAK